jgi:hypothetical protein
MKRYIWTNKSFCTNELIVDYEIVDWWNYVCSTINVVNE